MMTNLIASKPRTSFISTITSKLSIFFFITFTLILLLLQTLTLKTSLPFSSWPTLLSYSGGAAIESCNSSPILLNETRSRLRDSVTFLPLKDLRFASKPQDDHTWFMSSINDTFEENESRYLYFPSEASKGRLLCMHARDVHDGAKNSYGFAWPDALPSGATLFEGLTFVSDNFYDYSNLWHGLSAALPFAAWHESKGCVVPARWVLFHWGELRSGMSPWLETLMEVAMGNEVRIEGFGGGDGPACFETAVVFRHNQGGMSRERMEEVFDMMRCKARSYCNVTRELMSDSKKAIRMTLLFRTESRSFKNEAAVVGIFADECKKMEGCQLKLARPDNLTFCDQVRLLSETDILVSPHGAQMTNMFFMDKKSSVMEFFPKGWLEFAGIGQYVFEWLAEWSGMRHRGQWKDPDGEPCPYNTGAECFDFYKDARIGHDEGFFANWTAGILQEIKAMKISEASNSSNQTSLDVCPCV